MENKATGIILAAGNSTRYNKKINKNLDKINNKPLLLYSLEVFLNNKNIDEIIIVTKKEEQDKVLKVIPKDKRIIITPGGKERKDSVYNALKIASNDIVIIHDGARPLIKDSYINNCLKEIKKHDGCTIGVKAKDTIKIVDKNNIVIETTKRVDTYQIQTPQCFNKSILKELHEKNRSEDITDDCMLLERAGYNIKIIDGDYTNIKVTTKEDLDIAKLFINKG
ncbi:MAG: 2-C-methyl-D-erythritol 4-phosphate cytidylyltransferase [Bacilli bacterium]|nr:2-C-methyl-D-erythritol 4-phosphate cytidylyltransferase [Bacilli bacterium]